jgi:tetratricopeptide (TPR) repeat protein
MVKRLVAVAAAFLVLAVAASASAQGWRGQGRVSGKVTDESGKALEGVVVKLFLPSENGGLETKTNKKGEWAVAGIARGGWAIDFLLDGYEPRRISVNIQEMERLPMIETVMKKAAPDPNTLIAEEVKKASALVAEKKYGEAQAIYAALLAKYPQAYQLEIQIARAYHLEDKHDLEIEHFKKYLEKNPDDVQVKLLAGSEMISKGNPEEGKALLASIDESQVKEAAVFVNVGINLLNQNKAVDALPFFEKAIARFPNDPDAYYYRGITNIQLAASKSGDSKEEGQKLLAAGKADLEKFVAMAPSAPEAELAKKMLEQLK